MNKIYRRLWSTARQCWIVASELASPRGKRASTVLAAGTVGLVMLATVAQAAEREVEPGEFDEQSLVEDYPATPYVADPALRGLLSSFPLQSAAAAGSINSLHTQVALTTDNFYRDSTVSGDLQMILGSRSSLTGSKSVGYGSLLTASGTNNVAVGYGVRVRQGYSTAVGAESYTDGVGATAFGNNAKAYADNSIAVGSGSRTNDGAGISRIAIGGDAYAGSSGWTGAIALGGDSRAEYDGVVIGYGAKSSATGAVALGSWSVANETNTVSVGSSGTKRRIVNVNDARLSSTSSDAVTGKQLYATNSNVTKAQTAADGAKTTATAAQSTANTANSNANSALAKANAVSGLVSQVSAAGNVRLGGENTGTVLDVRNKSNAVRSITGLKDGALSTSSTEAVTGKQLNATNTNVTSAKTAADAAKTTAAAAQSTATTANTNANTALAKANTVSGLVSQVSATGNVRLGGENTGTVLDARNKSNAVRSITGLKDGALSASSTEAVTGKQLNATNANVTTAQTVADAAKTTATAAQTTATTANTNANTALAKANTVSGLVSQVSASGNVRLGGENTGTVLDARNKSNAVRSITGLKDGALSTSSTEAVTGKQLNATNSNVAAVKSTADAAQARVAVLNGLVGQVSASGNVRLGADNTGTVVDVANKTGAKRKLQNLANGVLSASSADAVTGQQLNATNSEVSSVRTAATAAKTAADAARGVADGAVLKADALGGLVGQVSASGNVRLGAENTGTVLDVRNKSNAVRSITGLKDGALSTSSTEAVTGKQLNATNTNVTSAKTAADAAKTTAAAAQSTATTANTNANTALAKANTVSGLVSQVSATGNVRLGGENTGTVLDARNKSNAVRSITGLKDGALSASSTEAVTGKQLNATNANVTTAQTVADAAKTTATAAQTTATTANTNANTALAKANTVSGLVSQVSASGNVRLGGENTGTVLDARNKSNAVRSITGLKDGALSTSSTEAVTGKQLNATNSNVAAVKSTADAAQARVAVLNGLVGQVSASGNVRLGADNTGTVVDVANKSGAKRKLQNLANGVLSTSSTDAVTGQQLNATNSEVTSVRTAATAAKTAADAARGVADGAVLKADALGGLVGQVSASGNVRLGAENTGTIVDVANKTGAKRRIYNIANGTLSAGSTDAVTGQQLFATNATVETQRQDLAGHAQQLADQDGRIADNRVEVDALRADFDNFDPDLDGVVKFSANRRLVDMEGARVSGVAAGDISSATSTDAVNGGQLFATNVRVREIEREGRFLSIGFDDESIDADAGLLGIALGDSARASVSSEGGVAIGSFAAADALNSVALGRGAVVAESAESGFALGVGSNVYAKEGVAFGALSRVVAGADGAVALGSYSVATEENTVSVGNSSVKRRLVNLDRGISDHDATTITQLNEALAGLGGGAGVDALGNVVGPTYSVQGGKQDNVGDALAALDGAVVRSDSRVDGLEGQLRATFQQSSSTRVDGVGQLNLAGTQGMVLSNLADGRIAAGSRDAVTGSQLYAAKQDIARNREEIEQLASQAGTGASQRSVSVQNQGLIDFGGARVTGVLPGEVSAHSYDAVTGAQLFESNSRISNLEQNGQLIAVSKDQESIEAKAGLMGVAIGDGAEASLDSDGGTALGSYARARGRGSVALGRGSFVHNDADGGIAISTGANVYASGGIAIGNFSTVERNAVKSVAIGGGSVATEADTVSFGSYTYQRRLVNVANGRNTNDAATIGQLRGALSTLGGNIDANGNVTTPGFNVQGQHQSTVNDALTTLDSAVVTTGSRMDRVETQLRSVFQETPSTRSDGTHQLTLAGANGMVISNVANGLIAAGSREAVNGGQLHAVQQQLNGRMDGLEQRVDGQPQSRALSTASAAPTEQVTPTPEVSGSPQVASAGEGASPAPQPKSKKDDTPSPTPQVDTAELEKMLARANEYTDGAISNFERRLDKMDKRFNRMAAMSSAQTAMAMNTAGLATYNRLGAGVGYAEGESAMAVGYQRVLNDKGSATFSLNGAFTNSGERSMGVGVGIGW
ncbi:ESPR-type extended signal peptide-containing protein [Stenotrophomonas indicatrix]|uniref:ESPR-type extended signal peptide-containing protein n=1 Tax=Stenotrophomonas indicatrix TaxID=2045451 RepID=UPI00372EBE55